MKNKIHSLSYNAMFKAVMSNNKIILSKLVQAILDYWKFNVDVTNKELILNTNELPLNNFKDKQLICDYIIKLSDNADLNIEINRTFYIGLVERNLTYSFKIFYEHFKSCDNNKEFNRYCLIQVNFNNYKNNNDKRINKFLMIDVDDVSDTLSKNLGIMNIDIASCYNFVYNNDNKEEISDLERLSAMVYCDNLEDISNVLGDDLFSMEEKKKILDSIKEISKDKDIERSLRLEDNIDYRFELYAEDALERGIQQGKEENLINVIKNRLEQNFSLSDISKATNKSIDEIKDSIKEISKDKNIEKSLRLEDNIDYRFELYAEDALQKEKEEIIKSMLKKNYPLEEISDITGKTKEEIEKIKESLKA